MDYPIVTVGALILNEDGKILLLKSHKWQDKYILPSGKVKFGETLKQAAIREVKEETNLDVHDLKFLALHELTHAEEYFKLNKHFVSINFTCKADSTDVILNDEAEEFVWVSKEEALKMDMENLTKNAVEILISKI